MEKYTYNNGMVGYKKKIHHFVQDRKKVVSIVVSLPSIFSVLKRTNKLNYARFQNRSGQTNAWHSNFCNDMKLPEKQKENFHMSKDTFTKL